MTTLSTLAAELRAEADKLEVEALADSCDDVATAKRNAADRLDALAREGWLPIAEAPKDAYEVLLADADADSVCVGFWHDGSQCYGHRGGEGWFESSDRGSLLTASNFRATHWQPLPPPPTRDA